MNDLVPVKKTATFVKDLEWRASARLYKLSEPVPYSTIGVDQEQFTNYVIASAIFADFSGEETLVFPAKEDGEALNMLEIAGGRGYMNHGRALAQMGFELVDSTNITID